ncbi:hypothetical protein PIB30_028058 [Stylosanthes scabra]|uniref:Uncharacterized protein n=1 Tax=Stylosanthes scabra TaxID=79078 RepID=A0ABU6RBD3_9FABA|nr:hypothetical protein [Stylosanthes scabra]
MEHDVVGPLLAQNGDDDDEAPPPGSERDWTLPWTEEDEGDPSMHPNITPPRHRRGAMETDPRDGFTGSSRSSEALATPGSDPLTRSVASDVSGIQCNLRQMGNELSSQGQAISDIRQGIKELAERFPKCRGGRRQGQAKCGCVCGGELHNHNNTARGRDSGRKQRKGHTGRPSNYSYNLTYVPPIDLDFSVDHMPFQTRNTPPRRSARKHAAAAARTPIDVVNLCFESDRESVLLPRRGTEPPPSNLDRVPTDNARPEPPIRRGPHIVFVPSRDMNLSVVHSAVAAFIFSSELQKKGQAVLVGSKEGSGGRYAEYFSVNAVGEGEREPMVHA